MIEIIPNWHPVFVHFSIGLLSISALFHLVAAVNGKSTNYYQFESVANWNLWIGAILTLVTVVAGWLAYNSVEHDTPSHLAMTDHRNWAMVTAGIFVAIAFWSFQRAKKAIPIGWPLTVVLLVATALLLTTGWKGGELVYKHGLGVMSLPSKSNHDHGAHDHGDAAGASGHSHDSIDMSDDAKPMENDASHEVGEIDHGHDSIDAVDKPVEANSQEKVDAAKDGHTHEHGDHTH